jgi:hydroxymethylbilane synthase
MSVHLNIGSRRSRLAQKQAEMCRDALMPFLGDRATVEIKVFQTTGDAYLSGNLSEIGNKGLFTKEIEHALMNGEIDIAVHSMKDVATILPSRLIIPSVLPRDDARDVLLCAGASSIATIPHGAKVGTSSLRRAVQMKYHRPDIHLVPYRGNLDRRITRLESGAVDATLLAAAGLDRLGMVLPYANILSIEEMLPAVSQGAIGLQCRTNDVAMQELLLRVNDTQTMTCITAERAMLRALDGSCRTPIAGYATLEEGIITLEGMVANDDGSSLVRATLCAAEEDAEALGKELAAKLRDLLNLCLPTIR